MIETHVVYNDFKDSSFEGMAENFESVEPIVLEGDLVTLSGWDEPITGEVKEVRGNLILTSLPIAVPGGGYYCCSTIRIQKLQRNGEVWTRA